eukprot:s23_g12.t1
MGAGDPTLRLLPTFCRGSNSARWDCRQGWLNMSHKLGGKCGSTPFTIFMNGTRWYKKWHLHPLAGQETREVCHAVLRTAPRHDVRAAYGRSTLTRRRWQKM